MDYDDRVVCFLDVLAFKQHVAQSIKSDGTDSTTKIRSIFDMFEAIRDILDIDRPSELRGQEVTQFSDSIVISFLADTQSEVFNSLLSLLWMLINLVQRGYLCRGGVARGRVVHTKTILFGPAMVEAYDLESKVAIYPRVILSEEIIRTGVAAHARHHLPIHEEESIRSMLELDFDGMYYINYLTGAKSELDDPEIDYPQYLGNLCGIVASGITSADPVVAAKYQWMRSKVAGHLREQKEGARSLPENDERLEAYLSIPDL